jgi:hypothetical protein
MLRAVLMIALAIGSAGAALAAPAVKRQPATSLKMRGPSAQVAVEAPVETYGAMLARAVRQAGRAAAGGPRVADGAGRFRT